MWTTEAVTVAVLWLQGSLSSYTMRGFANVLLESAILLLLFRPVRGRRPTAP